MVRNIYLNGQIKTLLVLQDEGEVQSPNPVYEALKEQADRIDILEQQNKALINQGEVLLKLLEISTETGNLIAHTLSGEEDQDFPDESILDSTFEEESKITE